MSERPIPKLDPSALREERRDVDLGTEGEGEGYDHVARRPGHGPDDDGDHVISQPTGGASPPAR